MDKKLSIEESLLLLKQDSSPSRSPHRAKKTQRDRKKKSSSEDKPDDDIFDLLESPISVSSSPVTPPPKEAEDDSDEEDAEKDKSADEAVESPSRPPSDSEEESEPESPKRPDSDIEASAEESEEEEEEEVESPIRAPSDSEGSAEESEEEEEGENEEVELKGTRKILPITPKRFTVSSPRTPTEKLEKKKRGKRNDSFLDKLRDFRYDVMRIIYLDGTLKYMQCYDAYGEIVFLTVPEGTDEEISQSKKKENIDKVDTVKISTVAEKLDNPLDEAYVNSVKERVTMDVFGLIFYNGVDYQICERNRKSFFKDRYCVLKGDYNEEKLSLPQTYIITMYSDIFEDHQLVIEHNRENYERIQKQQLDTSNHTFKEIVRSLRSVEDHMVKFKEVYQSHSRGIMSDWNIMGNQAKEYYQKYSDQVLEEDENQDYERVRRNMLLRFQLFIQSNELMDRLQSLKDNLDRTTSVLSDAIDEIGEKDENVKHRLVEIDEVDRYI